jgi:hypothetical protein
MELRKDARVFVKTVFTDLRKQINGLAAIVQHAGRHRSVESAPPIVERRSMNMSARKSGANRKRRRSRWSENHTSSQAKIGSVPVAEVNGR